MIAPGQHRLQRFQLINWGTFDHYVDLPIPRSGLLVTGESGSGKSSLLDAMAAVLVKPAKLTWNAAAQEGGISDRSRSLLTYVRGAYKRKTDVDSGELVTANLRPGAAWSAIALSYGDGLGKTTSLIRLLHAASNASAAKDVRSLFIVAEEPLELLSLEPYAKDGLDIRRLKAAFPSWTITTDKNYSGFAQKMQRCFGLESDQAQILLHKTQSAKNLTSLDVLLRDFMLDPPETFDLANQAIEQFDELSNAHHSVVDARRQAEVLTELDVLAEQRQALVEQCGILEAQQAHLEAFTLQQSVALLEVELKTLSQRLAALEREVKTAEDTQASRRAEQDAAQRKVEGLGGRELEMLQEKKAHCAQQLERIRAERTKLSNIAREAGLELPSEVSQLEDFLRRVELRLQELGENEQERESRYALSAQADQAKRAREQVEQQLRTLETQRSALDERLLTLRKKLAESAGVALERLSFAGELLGVRPEEASWTGAIERVLRNLSQTLLVPDGLYPLVSDYVNRNHLGLRLVYLRVPSETKAATEPQDRRSLVYKLTISAGESSEWLLSELIRRFDYLCVSSVADLRSVERGVTISGQVKHSATRHEKDDRSRVDDPSRWMLGSSIKTKQAALQAELQRLRSEELEAVRLRDKNDAEHQKRQILAQQLNDLSQLEWPSIDEAAALHELEALRAQIDILHESNGGLVEAQAQLRRAEAAVNEVDKMLKALHDKQSRTQWDCERKQQQKDEAYAHLATLPPVPEAVAKSLSLRFEQTGLEQPEKASRQVLNAAREELQKLSSKLRRVETSCIRIMSDYKNQWPAAAADLASEIDYLNEYLVILKDLRADRLPEFESRFFELLQKQSRNNIGEIAQTISRSRREIRLRVEPINRSLEQTEYAPGKHLKLHVTEFQSRDVQEFLSDLSSIASGSLEDTMNLEPSREERERAEERYLKLERLLRRLDSPEPVDRAWRKQCLDTRLHVRFRADVIAASSGQVEDVYTGAGGLSGGERQKLVIFCLAAALRYQLAREGSLQPSYGLVILDEAFDKTDPAFTKAGLDVFSSFGFQLLLATPLKMLQTLEAYVGGAVQVSNCEGEGSRCEKLIWESEDEAGAGQAPSAPVPPAAQDSLL